MSLIVDPKVPIHGWSQAQLADEWAWWEQHIPSRATYRRFSTRHLRAQHQGSPVWFLASRPHIVGDAPRTCFVPPSTTLFVAVDIVFCYSARDIRHLDVPPELLIKQCETYPRVDQESNFLIDGHPLNNLASYRQAAREPRDFFEDNPEKAGRDYYAYAGHFVALGPLEVGQHNLVFGRAAFQANYKLVVREGVQ